MEVQFIEFIPPLDFRVHSTRAEEIGTTSHHANSFVDINIDMRKPIPSSSPIAMLLIFALRCKGILRKTVSGILMAIGGLGDFLSELARTVGWRYQTRLTFKMSRSRGRTPVSAFPSLLTNCSTGINALSIMADVTT